ncbi:hypothetical protein [Streptomyces cylindrosporus]|uniref:DUF4760 domain-containing protein n=1 Tax=Streptomyces cylindrosporus TaxID=2927583 RepID=A0ABS9YIC0_9ACTN|nr:hypothetical protein [Streptomyces cylindrosporus]MCI3276978.1 hypothetical protein [Streptomyces cylindrosporus]
MQTETLVGLISGLGGAVIGSMGALGGAWLQQRSQAKNSKRERDEQRALSSGEVALNELLRLNQLTDAVVRGTAEENWKEQAAELVRHAEIAIRVIPNSFDLRETMAHYFFAMQHYHFVGNSGALATMTLRTASAEGFNALAAFLRGDELPKHSETFLAMERRIQVAYMRDLAS